jgi:lipopolysaccharide export LptBFGC system permease protein LptF
MKPFLSPALLIACAAALVAAGPAPASNQYTVTVDNGPHAGKYTGKAEDIQCIQSKSQKILFATFSTLDAHTGNSGVQSGIRVYDPDAPGAKTGELSAEFGTFVNRTAKYLITKIPITLTVSGKGADIVGAGKTTDGVQIHVSASCPNVLQM